MKGTEHHQDHKRKQEHEHGDRLEDLFRNVSARERPTSEVEQAVRVALYVEWTGMTRHSKKRRVIISWAIAASIGLVFIAGLSLLRSPQVLEPVMPLATVEKLNGAVLVKSSGGGARHSLATSGLLETGQRIQTRLDSGIAIRWHNGESIRLDENTELSLQSANEIDLLTGRIYVDTTAAGASTKLLIATPAGLVRHLGTRYMTSVSANGTSVSVRDGRVLVEAQGVETVAEGGEQLRVDVAGAHSLGAISIYGPMWQWAEELAPAFSSDGRSMADFLNWVARESGRVVEFDSLEAEKLAGDTLLRGKVEMDPMRALRVMMETSDLTSEVTVGMIIVRISPGG